MPIQQRFLAAMLQDGKKNEKLTLVDLIGKLEPAFVVCVFLGGGRQTEPLRLCFALSLCLVVFMGGVFFQHELALELADFLERFPGMSETRESNRPQLRSLRRRCTLNGGVNYSKINKHDSVLAERSPPPAPQQQRQQQQLAAAAAAAASGRVLRRG